jgi:hypothetical protein
VVGLVALVVSTLVAIRVLAEEDWDPTALIAFGEKAIPTREYAEERLGSVHLRPEQGHDGKFFFVQANDPWIARPGDNAQVLDRPLYRSQRMLYPVLVGGAGAFGPETIVWSMLVVNLIAMGVGSWVVALIATDLGGSAWWGLAFVLNPGFISELTISGAGVVAAAAAFGALLVFMRGHSGWGIVLLSFASLAREAMLISAVGIAAWLWSRRERGKAVLTVGIPLATVLAWGIYVRLRIHQVAVTPEVEEIGWPFVGLMTAVESWRISPIDLVAGVAIVMLFVLYTRRVIFSRHVVGLAFVGFVLLGVLFTEQVWHSFFDITRAVAPIITSFALLLVFGSRSDLESTRNEIRSSGT